MFEKEKEQLGELTDWVCDNSVFVILVIVVLAMLFLASRELEEKQVVAGFEYHPSVEGALAVIIPEELYLVYVIDGERYTFRASEIRLEDR